MLSSTSHTHAILNTRPISLSKIRGIAVGEYFLQLYHKNKYGDPHFLFHDFNNNIASFLMRKRLAKIYVQIF